MTNVFDDTVRLARFISSALFITKKFVDVRPKWVGGHDPFNWLENPMLFCTEPLSFRYDCYFNFQEKGRWAYSITTAMLTNQDDQALNQTLDKLQKLCYHN